MVNKEPKNDGKSWKIMENHGKIHHVEWVNPGKSTISTGPWLQVREVLNYQRVFHGKCIEWDDL